MAPRERKADRALRADRIYRILETEYPDAHCALHHRNPYELTVATILSAQCTDERVNMVTPSLFDAFPDPQSLAQARQHDVEELVRSTGFFRNKAKNLIGMADAVMDRHDGVIPNTMEALVSLPGVGRKTANVVLGNAFDIDHGIVVDTHVKRLSKRLGFTRQTDPVKVETDLVKIFPRERWTMLSHLLIFHGRKTCVARKPRCADCCVAHLCPSADLPG
ncbi:MAG: endonuclease III [Gemmatimonadales bacterium]|nr:MAG: endonuclease III [Gemmatimonadales bacterium]